jgi:guanine deaminase
MTAPLPPVEAAAIDAFRAEIVAFRDDPSCAGERALIHHADGMLVVRDGHVAALDDAARIAPSLPPGTRVTDLRGKLLLPGFVDAHVHFVQTDVIAAPGAQLLDWLERYTFPAERRFADPGHAAAVAEFFLDELLRNGTTTALVYATADAGPVDIFFAAAERRGLRMICGRSLMDRSGPEDLRDSAARGYADSAALIARWHGRGRLRYAVSPRWAPGSTEEQLRLAARLLDEHDGLHLHSHVAENRDEVRLAAEVFPWSRSYVDVYDRFGLLRERAVYAHGIWIDDADRARLAATGTTIAFCPTANLFLGSGLFDLAAARARGVKVAIGTDVGAGTSFGLLRTLAAAYGVAQLGGYALSALEAFDLATRGGAAALGIADCVGSLAVGQEADFVVLDPEATPLLARRTAPAESLADKLFALMMLGDDRAVAATYVLGRCAHNRDLRAIARAGAGRLAEES